MSAARVFATPQYSRFALFAGADAAAFGDDGLGSELAHLVLWPIRLFLASLLIGL